MHTAPYRVCITTNLPTGLTSVGPSYFWLRRYLKVVHQPELQFLERFEIRNSLPQTKSKVWQHIQEDCQYSVVHEHTKSATKHAHVVVNYSPFYWGPLEPPHGPDPTLRTTELLVQSYIYIMWQKYCNYVFDNKESYFGGLRSRWIKAFGFIACR